jgi:hypothetical protein
MRPARFEGISNCLEVVLDFLLTAVWNAPILLSVFLSTAIASTTSCRPRADGNAIKLALEDFGPEPKSCLLEWASAPVRRGPPNWSRKRSRNSSTEAARAVWNALINGRRRPENEAKIIQVR